MVLNKLPPWAISSATTLYNKTGSWRNFRPVYQTRLPPCNDACPAGEKVQDYIDRVNLNDYRSGWEMLTSDNPFPAVCGRVCFHPCETACNRTFYDEPIAIHHIERFVGDYGLSRNLKYQRPKKINKKRIAIIGGGPAGLACAYNLALLGYRPTIYEASPKLGGLLTYGIPAYRLPKEIVHKEINRILKLGVNVRTNIKVGKDVSIGDMAGANDAIFIATGAGKERKLGIAGEDHPAVIPALELLHRLNSGHKVSLGKKVAVIGGGNAAMDAARSLLRLGKEPVVIYRRTKAEMPAIPDEIAEAEEETIQFIFLATPIKIISKGNRITALECIRMKLGAADKSGRRQPIPVKGSNFKVAVDAVVPAIGEQPDLAFLPTELVAHLSLRGAERRSNPDKIATSRHLSGLVMTSKVFAGGDALTGPRTVVEAIGAGKSGAYSIDRYLKRKMIDERGKMIEKPVAYEELNLNYFEHQPRNRLNKMELANRIKSFREVYHGYSDKSLHQETGRCFSCGVCNRCDNCFVFCPDAAVLKKGNRYEFNYDYCKGCGVCVLECPRQAIKLEEEKR